MGPVMPPSKKPVGTGVSVVHSLTRFYPTQALQEEEEEEEEEFDLPLPLPLPAGSTPRPEKAGVEDEELTNLNWLHESKNLLHSFSTPGLRSVSPVQDVAAGDAPPSDPAYDAKRNPNCKPPYSFSCLIFMAIEDAPSKRLPVKDIYGWILEHFPYFSSAPTGWKNSVRHNLSLNKCFRKVDKDRSQSIGKGSLWCIDPEYRQNLIQALKKTPFHPYSQVFCTPPTSPQAYQSFSSPPLWPGNTFFRKNGEVLLQVSQGVIRNGARVSHALFPTIRDLPICPIEGRAAAMRSVLTSCDSSLVSGDPQEEHNYSSAKSSAVAPGDEDNTRDGSDSSFHGNDPAGSDTEDDDKGKVKKEPRDWPVDSASCHAHHKKRQPAGGRSRLRGGGGETLPLKKRRTEKPPESDDEEMKEAAGSLLHLAGVRACLNNITNRAAKGQKDPGKT